MEKTILKSAKLKFSKNVEDHYPDILSPDALSFLTALHERFNSERLALLEKRVQQQTIFDEGKFPEFSRETMHIRNHRIYKIDA